VGIDLVLFQRLARLAPQLGGTPGRALMLGRQRLVYRGKGDRFFNRALAEAGRPDLRIGDLVAPDGYAERALEALGFGRVEALDYSPAEGARHIHDLNDPVKPELRGRFDFILDGGTIEHVFDVPAALLNVFEMLRPGGVFASANGMNGWWGHGLYQMSADLAWSFWTRSAGCQMLTCEAVPALPKFRAVPLPDPAAEGHRLRRLGSRLPPSRVYLYYEVRKTEGARITGPAYQSDYAASWAARAPEMESST
jgi:SAM-dependent methyltransferase